MASKQEGDEPKQYGFDEYAETDAKAQNRDATTEANAELKSHNWLPNNGLVVGAVALALVAGLVSIRGCTDSGGEKLPDTGARTATPREEHCVFHGIRRFRAWKDIDIGKVVPKIADIEEMPECRDEALAQVIRMNTTHPYATTSLVGGQRATHPYRIVVKKP